MDERFSDRLLRYGTLIKKEDFPVEGRYTTVHIIRYEGRMYYHKMVNGDVVELDQISGWGRAIMWRVYGYNDHSEEAWLCNVEAETVEQALKKAYSIYGSKKVTGLESLA